VALPCEVRAGQFTVRGISLGGVQTCLQVPQLDLIFDCGHCPRSLAGTSRLFLSHGHADHAGGLISILSLRELCSAPRPLQIYASESMADPIERVIAAYVSMEQAPYRYDLTAVQPGDEIPLGQRRFVRPFRSDHVIQTLGYTAWERVRKLKPEFLGRPGREIARLKIDGEPIFDELERPLVSYPADTRIEVLDSQPHLLRASVLILEATYIDDRKTPAQCTKHGHVHLDQILERADTFENEHIVLTHFSQAYRPEDCHAIVQERCQGKLRPQVHVMAPASGSWPG
jgi:ribonuclease Z